MEGKRNVIPIAVGPAFFAENATGKYYVPLGSDTIFHLSVTDKGSGNKACTLSGN